VRGFLPYGLLYMMFATASVAGAAEQTLKDMGEEVLRNALGPGDSMILANMATCGKSGNTGLLRKLELRGYRMIKLAQKYADAELDNQSPLNTYGPNICNEQQFFRLISLIESGQKDAARVLKQMKLLAKSRAKAEAR
jgi:hypothetical protein